MAIPELRGAVERDLQRLQRRADRLVVRHRRAVEAIAEALADRRHLTGDEVRALFGANRATRIRTRV
jgi:cell division protease FtsH